MGVGGAALRRSASATTHGTGATDSKQLHQSGAPAGGGASDLNTSRSRSMAGGGGIGDSSLYSGVAGGGGGAFSMAAVPNVYVSRLVLPVGSGPPVPVATGYGGLGVGQHPGSHGATRGPLLTQSHALLPQAGGQPLHSARVAAK